MDERFTARMLVASAISRKGLTVEDLAVAPVVVLSWNRKMVQSLAEAAGARRSEHWFYGEQYPLFTGEADGHRVSIALVPVGAPGTVMHMEEMMACGARTFIGLGFTGSLQPAVTIGSLVIPTSCISEEGTSSHYTADKSGIAPAPRLARLLEESCRAEGAGFHSGPQWTTDAPYRELVSKIEAYRSQGVMGVDMETSAMYAVGRVREAEVCNLLVASDEVWREWRWGAGRPELQEGVRRAIGVVMRLLKAPPSEPGDWTH